MTLPATTWPATAPRRPGVDLRRELRRYRAARTMFRVREMPGDALLDGSPRRHRVLGVPGGVHRPLPLAEVVGHAEREPDVVPRLRRHSCDGRLITEDVIARLNRSRWAPVAGKRADLRSSLRYLGGQCGRRCNEQPV